MVPLFCSIISWSVSKLVIFLSVNNTFVFIHTIACLCEVDVILISKKFLFISFMYPVTTESSITFCLIDLFESIFNPELEHECFRQ